MNPVGTHPVESIRRCFPFIKNATTPIHYLDSAASSQKPECVIDRIRQCYEMEYANVHRGVYRLSEGATVAYEATRDLIANFLGGVSRQEVIFTSGTTSAINLISRTWGEENIGEGDEILVPVSEHHSNIVPWQLLAERKKARVRFIPLTDQLIPDLEAAKSMVSEKTKIIGFAHVSNVTGLIYPVAELVALAKQVGAVTVVDGAQAVPHFQVDVKELGCDFYCFSGHKMLGPSGVGVLWGRERLLDAMPPFMGGGDMIASVTTEGSTWNALPYKFEAGTPAIAPVTALGSAVSFLQKLDLNAALEHDRQLSSKLTDAIKDCPGIRLFTNGQAPSVGVVTFYHEKIHPHDMAAIADSKSVCVRAGHHCAQPFMNWLGVPATTRISPYLYNNAEDVDKFIEAFQEANTLFNQE